MPYPTDASRRAVEEARRLYRQRRGRDREFGTALFGEPAWDLLLDLFVAASEQRPVSVMSASIAATVSAEHALHWLTRLEEHGLVERLYAGTEMHRATVTLSEPAFHQMTRLLQPDS
jgi:hypothetical protein